MVPIAPLGTPIHTIIMCQLNFYWGNKINYGAHRYTDLENLFLLSFHTCHTHVKLSFLKYIFNVHNQNDQSVNTFEFWRLQRNQNISEIFFRNKFKPNKVWFKYKKIKLLLAEAVILRLFEEGEVKLALDGVHGRLFF